MALCLGPYANPGGVRVSIERGTPVMPNPESQISSCQILDSNTRDTPAGGNFRIKLTTHLLMHNTYRSMCAVILVACWERPKIRFKFLEGSNRSTRITPRIGGTAGAAAGAGGGHDCPVLCHVCLVLFRDCLVLCHDFLVLCHDCLVSCAEAARRGRGGA